MGYWITMLLVDLLTPAILLGFGILLQKHPPKEINDVYGYRTRMSTKNMDTWIFANTYCGRIWQRCGFVMLPVSLVVMLFVMGKNENIVSNVGGILCFLQLLPLFGTIFYTERALKKHFDANGNRKI